MNNVLAMPPVARGECLKQLGNGLGFGLNLGGGREAGGQGGLGFKINFGLGK